MDLNSIRVYENIKDYEEQNREKVERDKKLHKEKGIEYKPNYDYEYWKGRKTKNYFKDRVYKELCYEFKHTHRKARELGIFAKVIFDSPLTEKDVIVFWDLLEQEKKARREFYNRLRRLERNSDPDSREQKKQRLIKEIRKLKEAGLKQIEVSKELGINKSTVSRYWNDSDRTKPKETFKQVIK